MKEKKIVAVIAGLMVMFTVLIEICSHKVMPDMKMGVAPFNTGWIWEAGGGDTGETVLPAELEISAGETLVLRHELPEKAYQNDGVAFRSRQQETEVYVDGELIYQYPAEELIGDVLPSNWNFVKLPKDSGGKELEIRLTSPYKNFSGKMTGVFYGNYNDLLTFVKARQIPFFRMSMLIGMIGAVNVLLALLVRRYRLYTYQEMQGAVLMLTAVWLCGESRMPLVFLGVETKYYVTFTALVLLPVFILGYLYARWKDFHGSATGRLFYFSLALAAVILGAEWTGLRDFAQMLLLIHGLVGLSLGYMVWLYIQAFRRKKEPYFASEMVCISLILGAAAAEAGTFYSRSGLQVGIFVRAAVLLYALNNLRISILSAYRGLRERARLEQQLRRSRAELMTSQIKPHFIYNTLNSIRALIRMEPDAAYKAVYDFSTYLRANLSGTDQRETIPFGEELEHIRAYINIEKIRFEDRLKVEFDIKCDAFQVPALSVQPLVENAIKHGVCKRIRGGTVWVRSYEENRGYVIQVEDDGVGFDPEAVEQQEKEHLSMGLRNIRFRIGEISGGTMEIESRTGEGTKVTLRFPEQKENTGREKKGNLHEDRDRR